MKMKKHNEGILLISQIGEGLIFFFFLTESKIHRVIHVHRLQYQKEIAVVSIIYLKEII